MGSRRYSTPVDVWSIGCIFAEMHNGRPLFPGANEADQLDAIFKALGTPDEAVFPGIVELPDYKPTTYKRYPFPGAAATAGADAAGAAGTAAAAGGGGAASGAGAAALGHLVPGLGADGVDLLTRMLQYDPAKRITAKDALDVSSSSSSIDTQSLVPGSCRQHFFPSCFVSSSPFAAPFFRGPAACVESWRNHGEQQWRWLLFFVRGRGRRGCGLCERHGHGWCCRRRRRGRGGRRSFFIGSIGGLHSDDERHFVVVSCRRRRWRAVVVVE